MTIEKSQVVKDKLMKFSAEEQKQKASTMISEEYKDPVTPRETNVSTKTKTRKKDANLEQFMHDLVGEQFYALVFRLAMEN